MIQHEPLTKEKARGGKIKEFQFFEPEDVCSALEGLKDELCTGLKCPNCKIVDKWFPFAHQMKTAEFDKGCEKFHKECGCICHEGSRKK